MKALLLLSQQLIEDQKGTFGFTNADGEWKTLNGREKQDK